MFVVVVGDVYFDYKRTVGREGFCLLSPDSLKQEIRNYVDSQRKNDVIVVVGPTVSNNEMLTFLNK